uniref:Uncharacterized protein n=1 Tax=Arion vulgaris TaxID=1028688 RepID=A0A0B6ZTV1_9EUPU
MNQGLCGEVFKMFALQSEGCGFQSNSLSSVHICIFSRDPRNVAKVHGLFNTQQLACYFFQVGQNHLGKPDALKSFLCF